MDWCKVFNKNCRVKGQVKKCHYTNSILKGINGKCRQLVTWSAPCERGKKCPFDHSLWRCSNRKIVGTCKSSVPNDNNLKPSFALAA